MRALIDLRPATGPVAIGVGGGHYVPRLTDLALARDVAFGHLVSGHAVPHLDDGMVEQLVARTPGASLVYFHRKGIEKGALRRLEEVFSAHGLRIVREEDLEPLSPGPLP